MTVDNPEVSFGAMHNPYKWENVGNHDSCWIDAVDSRLSEVYFEMCAQVNKDKAPKLLNEYSDFDLFHPVEFVEVTLDWDTERNKEHGHQYWKKVTDFKLITRAEFDAYDKQDTL